MSDPFVADLREGFLYGRGSCDTKAGLAAMMHAVAHLKESAITPLCEVWLAAVVDELSRKNRRRRKTDPAEP